MCSTGLLLCRVIVPAAVAGLPAALISSRTRRTAVCDFLTRSFGAAVAASGEDGARSWFSAALLGSAGVATPACHPSIPVPACLLPFHSCPLPFPPSRRRHPAAERRVAGGEGRGDERGQAGWVWGCMHERFGRCERQCGRRGDRRRLSGGEKGCCHTVMQRSLCKSTWRCAVPLHCPCPVHADTCSQHICAAPAQLMLTLVASISNAPGVQASTCWSAVQC